MLFKLSARNIRRSLKDYAIYFFTLVLGVAIFYVFNSLESQTVMMNVSNNTHQIIGMMNSVMSVLSVFVAVVLGFLVIYASRFLMKRRKKEFGIYMTLGMGKGQISKILLVETLMIGLVSLAVGLILGVVLSQVMSVFVANTFEADMTDFRFVFSGSAMLMTIAMFSVIYLIVMIFNTVMVGKERLINLIHSDKVNEKAKMRNLTLSVVLFVVAVCLLAWAYSGVTVWIADLTDGKLLLYIVMGIIGTFLLFWSVSGLALRIVMRFKGFYYKGLNSFVFREVNSKINTTVISMSVICLLLFMTIGVFSSAMSIKSSMTKNLRKLVPVDLYLRKYPSVGRDDDGSEDFQKDKLSIVEAMAELGVDPEVYLSRYEEIGLYTMEGVTYRETIGREALMSVEDIDGSRAEFMLDYSDPIIKVSDYNRLAEMYKLEKLELDKGEYVMVGNLETVVEARNKALADGGRNIKVGDEELRPKYNYVVDGFIDVSSQEIDTGFLVVSDEVSLVGSNSSNLLVGNYRANDDSDLMRIEEVVDNRLMTMDAVNEYHLFGVTKIEVYEDSIGLSAMVTFISLYLGTIFLITSAALLGLKEISESSDNQEKYMILKKLGVDRKTLNKTLLAQIGIFFGLPLLVAVIHSVFGISFANKMILSFTNNKLLEPIIMTAVFIVVIYGGYFLITYYTSKRIIDTKGRRLE